MWVWGGLKAAWLPPVTWVSCLLLVICLWRGAGYPVTGPGVVPWWRDLFFYLGLLFIGFLVLQWWNAGRVQYYDVGFNKWTYSPPRHVGWPSAFTRGEAAQMIHWYFPPWVLGLCLRSSHFNHQAIRRLLLFTLYSAGLLAVFGIVQFLTRTRSHYWLIPMKDTFFASFGYANHAAAFFVMMGAVAAGFLLSELLPGRGAGVRFFDADPESRMPGFRLWSVISLLLTLLLCLTAANLTLSRAGVILAGILAAWVAIYAVIRSWNQLGPAGRLNLVTATAALCCLFYFAVSGLGRRDIAREFLAGTMARTTQVSPASVNPDIAIRQELVKTAYRIWSDNTVFGVGGWGFRYLMATYRPEAEWDRIRADRGLANVHNDFFQFLVEFGLVGTSLMVLLLLVLLTGWWRCSDWGNPLWVMSGAGIGAVCLLSLIDLPFRNPAILCAWVVIFAAQSRLTFSTTRHNVTEAAAQPGVRGGSIGRLLL